MRSSQGVRLAPWTSSCLQTWQRAATLTLGACYQCQCTIKWVHIAFRQVLTIPRRLNAVQSRMSVLHKQNVAMLREFC